MRKLLITTPIYYINAAPHVGSATTCVLADFFKRLYKLRGYDVYLTTGTDENGQKIQKSNNAGMSFDEFRTKNAMLFKNTFDQLEVSYDRFIRTTEIEHHEMVIRIWKILESKGHIYEGMYKGYYCVSDETFYTEKDLILKDGKYYTKDNKIAEYCERPAYFLRLENIKDEMLKFYETHKDITYPVNRVNEIVAFINEGFKDLCISRDDNIGVAIPNSNRTVYVWFDALINYIAASQCVIERDRLQKEGYWDNVIHLVGKDILTFHALFWIAMLKLANLLPNTITVFAHNWWVFTTASGETQKMSKSLGNVTDPNVMRERYGVDCLRFYFIFVNLINNDAQFNEDHMVQLFNSYMVNKFSNLVYRVFSLLKKRQIICDDVKDNDKYESVLLNCAMDINLYMRTLFEWCDSLNELVDKEAIWNNSESAVEIAKQINKLYKYFAPIAPSVVNKFKDKYDAPIFTRIKV